MINYTRITRREFYALGGFASTRCVRRADGAHWTYWVRA